VVSLFGGSADERYVCYRTHAMSKEGVGSITLNGTVPHAVRADRGTSMTSKPVSALLVDLGVTGPTPGPGSANDNPFSEAQFKSMKYLYDFSRVLRQRPGSASVL
jgi:hypothetical protein